MDPITHGLLGAATSQSLFIKKVPHKIWLVGLLAAMSPDLDIFINSSENPFLFLIYHRNFTHSLFFVPFGGAIIAGLFCLFYRTVRPWWPSIFIAAIITYGTHGILDNCTSYGTLYFWPISNTRVAWDIISIIDPFFTTILLFGAAFTFISKKSLPALIAIAMALLYLLLGVGQHYRASILQKQIITERHQSNISKNRIMPAVYNLSIWRSVYVSNEIVYLDTIFTSPFKSTNFTKRATVPLFTQNKLPDYIQKRPVWMNDFQVFSWFSDDLLGVYSYNPLIVADLRYMSLGDPFTPYWGIRFPPPSSSAKHIIFWRSF